MSAQLLICNFAVFTCVSFFLTDASHDYHGSLARSLSRPHGRLLNGGSTVYRMRAIARHICIS